jgi:pyruvate formate lyase activating enzyme
MSQVNKLQATSNRQQEKIRGIINGMSTDASPKEMVERAAENGCRGIAYTYNEPAIFPEYAHDTMELAREKGLKNVYVSNGFESQETFEYLNKYLDAINIDLKSFREEFYREVCKAKIGPVKKNIKRFFEAGIETEVTTLVIPGYNDTDKELTEIARFLVSISAEIPWHISAYSPAYKLEAPPTTHKTLVRAYNIGRQAGLRYVYLGNANDEVRLSTKCPQCEALLVRRWWHGAEVINLDIKKGKCKECGEKIYGFYS